MRRVKLRLRLRARTRVKVEVECGVWRVRRGPLVYGGGEGGPHRVWCVVWCGIIARLTERGECGPGDSVALVVVLKRRTTQREGA